MIKTCSLIDSREIKSVNHFVASFLMIISEHVRLGKDPIVEPGKEPVRLKSQIKRRLARSG